MPTDSDVPDWALILGMCTRDQLCKLLMKRLPSYPELLSVLTEEQTFDLIRRIRGPVVAEKMRMVAESGKPAGTTH